MALKWNVVSHGAAGDFTHTKSEKEGVTVYK